ncbi:MAG: hypothetical protein K0R28_3000 [Paenibacillus sp.]|jgi:hypothetical protein|nr:hypothetical protein [Paenibacillus sp.]
MIINGVNYLARGSGFSGDSDSIVLEVGEQ